MYRASLKFVIFSLLLFTAQAIAAPAKQSTGVNQRSLQLNERGVAAVKSKDFKRAEELFTQALAEDKYNLTAVFNLAGMYLTTDKDKDAVVLLERYTEAYPNDAGLLARLGDAYFASKDIEKAAASYEKSLKLFAKDSDVKKKLATIYSLSDRTEEAEEMLRQAAVEDPKDPAIFANLSSLLLANGKIEDAIGTAKKALQMNPTSEIYVTLGTAYEMSKRVKNAIIAFERARDLGDSRPELAQKISELKKVNLDG